MFCSKCGNSLMNEAIICPRCGCGTVNYQAAVSVPVAKKQIAMVQCSAIYPRIKDFCERSYSCLIASVFSVVLAAAMIFVIVMAFSDKNWVLGATALLMDIGLHVFYFIISDTYGQLKAIQCPKITYPYEIAQWESGVRLLRSVEWLKGILFVTVFVQWAVLLATLVGLLVYCALV